MAEMEVMTNLEEDVQNEEIIVTEDEMTPVEDDDMQEYANVDSFVDEENYDAFRLLNLKSKLNDVQRVTDDLKKNANQVLGDNADVGDVIDENIAGLTEDDIKNLSDEEIVSFFTFDDAEIEFAFEFKTEKEKISFMKDYLVFRRQSIDSIARLDTEMEAIQKEIAENQEEFDSLSNIYGNVSGLIRETLNEKIESADTDDKKALYVKLLDNFTNALTLDNLKTYLKSYKGKCVVGDFRNEKQTMYVYRTYRKICEMLKIETDLTSFNSLEKRFLSEEYQKRDNIFMFAVLHYIASRKKFIDDKSFGLFITQFTINLKNLYYDKFDTPEDKETFVEAIKEAIRIID